MHTLHAFTQATEQFKYVILETERERERERERLFFTDLYDHPGVMGRFHNTAVASSLSC